MAKQDYTYALNSDDQIVSIKDTITGQKYRCPFCESPMIQRKGEIRKWHFAHKANPNVSCSYESYLHKLAKIKIRECFLKNDSFKITFNAEIQCNYSECPVPLEQPCKWMSPKIIDLKKYYNVCEVEKGIDGYVADLLLSNSNNPNIPPILIEIFVTHLSTKEKISSNNRIIEISIKTEEDINLIINQCHISLESAKFFNFKGETKGIPTKDHGSPKFHFWVDSKYIFHFDRIDDYDYNYFCFSPLKDSLANSVFRVDALNPINWSFAFKLLAESCSNVKFCTMCKFYRFNDYYCRSMCILYKKKSTPQFPPLSLAKSCPDFELKDFEKEDGYQSPGAYKVYSK